MLETIFSCLSRISCIVSLCPFAGYILSDLGYDIWLANARGNVYSRRHKRFNPNGTRYNRKQFWNFSWHEIGVYDLPAIIDYVSAETNYTKMHYIGHSQGVTAFLVMTSERPEYNDKILLMNALAPAVYMSNVGDRPAQIFAKYSQVFEVCSRHFYIDISQLEFRSSVVTQ